MGYIGKGTIAPGHPFAHTSIHIGVKRPQVPKKIQPDENTATVSVEWGYEGHSIELTAEEWSKLRSKEAFNKDGPGFYYENQFFQDRWYFSPGDDEYELVVTYGDDGGTGYNGSLGGATIEEHLPKKKRTPVSAVNLTTTPTR